MNMRKQRPIYVDLCFYIKYPTPRKNFYLKEILEKNINIFQTPLQQAESVL